MAAIILYLWPAVESIGPRPSTTAYSFSCSETLFSIVSFKIREEMSRNSDNTNFDDSTAILLMEQIKEKDTKKLKDYVRVSSKSTKSIYM